MATTSDFLSKIIPGYSKNAGTASDVISQLLSGNPNTGASQIAGATFGVSNGQGPGSGIANRYSYDLYGQQSAARKQQGIQDLMSLISGISNPTLENQGQQFQNNQFGQNLGQRQVEFGTSQNNRSSDQYFSNLKNQQDASKNADPYGIDFLDRFGNRSGDHYGGIIDQLGR